jgi:hypothetical protein
MLACVVPEPLVCWLKQLHRRKGFGFHSVCTAQDTSAQTYIAEPIQAALRDPGTPVNVQEKTHDVNTNTTEENQKRSMHAFVQHIVQLWKDY